MPINGQVGTVKYDEVRARGAAHPPVDDRSEEPSRRPEFFVSPFDILGNNLLADAPRHAPGLRHI